jgi:hypothetical protein
MKQVPEEVRQFLSVRRWQRHPVDLPVRVPVTNRFSTAMISGRGTELSAGGMGLYAGLTLNPGDLLEVEFWIPCRFRVMAVVRYCSGYWFGLEFVTPLSI